MLIGNSERPYGGFSTGLDPITTDTRATPTETAGAGADEITTYDITGQYDPVSDFPTNPTNMFALANAVIGVVLRSPRYPTIDPSKAVLQDRYGDTEYYLIPTYPVPLLMPVQMIPGIGPVLADMFDPVVRVLVEAGYDRTISPGVPTPNNDLYSPDPTTMASNLSIAYATGMDNVSEDMGMGRPQGTTRPDIGPGSTGQGAYGIGGPPVTLDPAKISRSRFVSLRHEAPQLKTSSGSRTRATDRSWLEHRNRDDDGGVGTDVSEPGTPVSQTSTSDGPKAHRWNIRRFGLPGVTGPKESHAKESHVSGGARAAGATAAPSGHRGHRQLRPGQLRSGQQRRQRELQHERRDLTGTRRQGDAD